MHVEFGKADDPCPGGIVVWEEQRAHLVGVQLVVPDAVSSDDAHLPVRARDLPEAHHRAAPVFGRLEHGCQYALALDLHRRRLGPQLAAVPRVEHGGQVDALCGGQTRNLRRLGRARVRREAVAGRVVALIGAGVADGVVGPPVSPVVRDTRTAQHGEAERRPAGVVAAGGVRGTGESPPPVCLREVHPVDHGLLVTRARTCCRAVRRAASAQRVGHRCRNDELEDALAFVPLD